MSDEAKKDGFYIRLELPKGSDLKVGDSVSFTTRWQSDAPEYAEATSVFGRPVEDINQTTEEIGLGRDQFGKLTHLVCLSEPYREVRLSRLQFQSLSAAIMKALDDEGKAESPNI